MNLADSVKKWTNTGLGFVYPNVCQLCRTESGGKADGFVGESCQQSVKWIEPPFCQCCGLTFPGEIQTSFECANCTDRKFDFSFARSAALAKGPVLDAIHKYKYERALWVEPFLARLLITAAAPVLIGGQWDFIVPVPLHSVREREREFNQAQRLGACLSRATGIPLNAKFLRRIQPTPSQTRLRRDERLQNVRNAFAGVRNLSLAGKKIIIVDDVFTTGATTNACAAILREAGASEVAVWTVARGS
jgi:ComF family protein